MNILSSLNCSLQKDYKVPYILSEYSNISSTENVKSESKEMPFGAITGVLIAFFMDGLLSLEFNKQVGSLKNGFFKIFSNLNVLRSFIFIILVLILPVLVLFLLLTLICKMLCAVVIKRNDKNFISFLDSFDVFWSLEDDASKSVINVLGLIESDCPYTLALNIKEKLRHIVSNDNSKKIFYTRSQKFGFYYWRKHYLIDMDQYVEIVEFPTESDCLDITDLENLMTGLQEQTLPYGDEGLFKILITKQRVGSEDVTKNEFGIIFRIHHSVGDGVALIEFLCQTFADKTDSCPINMFSVPESCNHYSPSELLDMMLKLVELPLCFINGIIRKPDANALHGPKLAGKKIFKWSDSDENLLMMVKDIKDNFQQLNFSDILLTALSSGLNDFLLQKMGPVPEDLAVVLPVRFPKCLTSNDMILKNDFSVTILDIPIKRRENMNEINYRYNMLRRSADPLTNYYFLKLVCSVLPKAILQPLLNSSQATMVFSNMPGPTQLTICGGNVLKSLVFFVPHKGTTGLGVTALCYGGVLRFAAMADVALVSRPEELSYILEGMVREIRRLHQRFVKT